MRPLRNWLAVNRGVMTQSTVIELPEQPEYLSLVGTVKAVGTGPEDAKGLIKRPLDARVGDKIVYSARVDKYRVGDHLIDVIEEGSIIGRL